MLNMPTYVICNFKCKCSYGSKFSKKKTKSTSFFFFFFQINKYSRRAYLGAFLACLVGLLVEASQLGFLLWL